MNLRAPSSPRLARRIGGYLAGLFEMDLALAPSNRGGAVLQ